MNIFYCDTDINACAEALDDVRLNKMILETAQLLSTAVHISTIEQEKPFDIDIHPHLYKITHKNHPCAKWARESYHNYMWLHHYFSCLTGEYLYRKQKYHACTNLYKLLFKGSEYIPSDKNKTPHPNCTIYKDNPDTIAAYRKYLCYKWENDKLKNRHPKWTNTLPPIWYNDTVKLLYEQV